MAWFLVGTAEFEREMPVLPSWQPTEVARQLIQSKVVANRPRL